MMITKENFDYLINQFDLGTSTAEKDPLLPAAQIRTQQFYDLWKDRIDIVRGIKGAGKTALYRVFYLLSEDLAKEDNIFCIFGVEPTGDPVFRHFRTYFSQFTALEFEKFWTLYFLFLIRDKINEDRKLQTLITNAADAENLERLWKSLDVPYERKHDGLLGVIESILESFSSVKKIEPGIQVTQNNDGSVTCKSGIGVEFCKAQKINEPKYIGDIRVALCTLLKKQNFKIWIMLDRLDEVFPRRSKEEENGLKGLLKAAYNLSEPELRIKVFLRDDIIEQLATSTDGFAALTHVTDRSSPTLTWAKEKILLLIVKRVCSSKPIALHYSVDSALIENDSTYRESVFYNMFPKKIGKFVTLDWLINALSDGNGIVTPRDIIDLFNFAKAEEYKNFQLNPGDREFLVDIESMKKALEQLSSEKRNKYLMAEFPHMRDSILKLEGSYSIHTVQSLEKIFGSDWKKITADLISIGLLKHDPKKARYRIPKIWVKGLRITQGQAKY